MEKLDDFYLSKEEPLQGCLLALKKIILSQNEDITQTCKYGMPCFCFKGKIFCYLWFHKKYKKPYILMVEGQLFDEEVLISENRSKMKILLLDQNKDLPIKLINAILKKAVDFCKVI